MLNSTMLVICWHSNACEICKYGKTWKALHILSFMQDWTELACRPNCLILSF